MATTNPITGSPVVFWHDAVAYVIVIGFELQSGFEHRHDSGRKTSRTFLSLLTTQLQNQNPLDPLDTNQFTQQLVEFASVEQQLKTNDQLTHAGLAAAIHASDAGVGLRRQDGRRQRQHHGPFKFVGDPGNSTSRRAPM